MKLRIYHFCTFRSLFMDFRGSVKILSKIFLVKGGLPKLRNFVIRPPQKFRGGGRLRPPSELSYVWGAGEISVCHVHSKIGSGDSYWSNLDGYKILWRYLNSFSAKMMTIFLATFGEKWRFSTTSRSAMSKIHSILRVSGNSRPDLSEISKLSSLTPKMPFSGP